MFVVYSEQGEYSDYRMNNICVCQNVMGAKLAVSILKEMKEYMIEESKKFMIARKEFEDSLGIIAFPEKPHKSTIDPKNLISDKIWMKDYILPYKNQFDKANQHRAESLCKIQEFKDNYIKQALKNLPEKFIPFKDYFGISDYGYVGDDIFDYVEVPGFMM